MQTAFGIDSSSDDNKVHSEHFCQCCKLALDGVISAFDKATNYKLGIVPILWGMHSDDYSCAHVKKSAALHADM